MWKINQVYKVVAHLLLSKFNYGVFVLLLSTAWFYLAGSSVTPHSIFAKGHEDLPKQVSSLNVKFDSSPIWLSTIEETVQAMAWGDVDGDGDMDLAIGS